MLRAALYQFAEDGVATAPRARQRAEAALATGNAEDYSWWLEICRALDSRMAAAVESQARGGV